MITTIGTVPVAVGIVSEPWSVPNDAGTATSVSLKTVGAGVGAAATHVTSARTTRRDFTRRFLS
jgi:hypothetical protein